MSNSLSDYYRKINLGFLNKAGQDGPGLGFDLYYKTQNGGDGPTFMKFGTYESKTKEKIHEMMAARDCHTLFIHETDLIRYYKNFLTHNLHQSLDERKPYETILMDAYQVNKNILQEYFENIGSTKILRCLKDVVGILTSCMIEGKLEPIDVFNTTSKENAHPAHCSNAGLYNIFLGVQLKLPVSEIHELGLGGMLYDIGKKGIPVSVLEKQEELSPEDWQAIRKHPSAGRKVLNDMRCYSQNVLKMAAEHHEKYDGSGYPFGLQGNQISFSAQVCAISDVFNALVCKRYFHEPRTAFEALVEMKNNMPGHFDPQILINFIKAFVPPKK
jgi:HD-GYP domain-containing protein (c-di-GMP phosphodiesterase class II)